jgi:hypothetical protein
LVYLRLKKPKLTNVFEEVTAAAWMTGNAARVAGDRVGELKDPPFLDGNAAYVF